MKPVRQKFNKIGWHDLRMQTRRMTQEERAEFTSLRPPSVFEHGGTLLFIGLWAAICAGGCAYLALRFGFWLGDFPDFPARHPWAMTVGLVVGGLAAISFLTIELRQDRKRAPLRMMIDADLAHGEVAEEHGQIARITRLREPEHHTELLILHMTDGRVRALLDDSTTDTEGDSPRRSALRLGQNVTVLHLPASGRQLTRFSGKTVRRPKAIVADPRYWPLDDEWLDPKVVAGLMQTAQ